MLEKIKQKIIPRWEKLVYEFIDYFKTQNVSIKTVESYFLCLRAHTFKDWGDRFPDTITSNEIRLIISAKVGDRSESHKKNVLKYIRAVFNYAVEKAYMNRNPTPKMKFRVGDKIKKVLTKEQVLILLNQAKIVKSDWYSIWVMAIYTGMRNGELIALTWDKVNLEDKTILVDCSWNNKDGLKDTKSGDDRIVVIADCIIPMLKRLKLENFDSPYVLPRIEKWDKGKQADALRMFLEGLGLPRVRFHDLRATWATIMLTEGIAPIKVMSMGGWKDLKTMQKYIRKAGVNIKGITENLVLHDTEITLGKVLEFSSSDEL